MTELIDPIAEVVSLLQPSASFSKVVGSSGRWRVRRAVHGRSFFCVLLEGSSRLTPEGQEEVVLQAGDFVLIPAAQNFMMTSMEPPAPDEPDVPPVQLPNGEFRQGPPDVAPDVRVLIGYCLFASPDAALLVSLLPQLVHVRGDSRLAMLVQLVGDETRERRPARDMILSRLLEVLFIEALRSSAGTAASPGLVRAMADCRLATAIRQMHEKPSRPWTVADLAKEAALSRSAFFERFSRAVGMAPMEYLLAWRMALAKTLLRQKVGSVAAIAERVGYSSASTFSVAFTRHVGMPPTHYAVQDGEAPLNARTAPVQA